METLQTPLLFLNKQCHHPQRHHIRFSVAHTLLNTTHMIKIALLLFSVLGTMVAASSCDDCSPQCLDCRIRGFTRLSPDKSLAECFLQANPLGDIKESCPVLGNPDDGTAIYRGDLVCLQQRCTLSKGERCKLIGLNEDTCNYLVSSANSALDSTLSGCTSYLKIGDTGQCPPGYTPYCSYSGVPDILPTVFGGDINVLDSNSVYTAIPDVLALTQYELGDVFGITGDPCADTITDKHGFKLQLVLEGCVPATGQVVGTPFAGILANGECSHHHQKLIAQGLAGCYTVTGSNLVCNPNSTKAGSADRQIIGSNPEYIPQCYYRLANKDNDPNGCQRRRGHRKA